MDNLRIYTFHPTIGYIFLIINMTLFGFFFFLLQGFFSPHLKLFRESDFDGADINITIPVTNMEETGYGTKAQSLDVIGGV